jgi:uncharacterized protein YyaL (SSP411 family)
VQALSGGGGWPMSVFLMPDQQPFFGGTFYPYDQFLMLVSQIADAFENKRDQLQTAAGQLGDILKQNPAISNDSKLATETIDAIADSAKSYYDNRWGGFASKVKFPTPVRWQFLLHYYRKTGDPEIAKMIKHTLDMMASGGINDHIGGGFHRYTVDDTWLVPHFEKMLYDNAQLAILYLEAAIVFDDPDYAATARATLDFMISDMSGPEGAFYSSYDADSDGEEGRYYVWTPTDVASVAGGDAPALAALLDITAKGNFEGSNVVTRRADINEIAEQLNVDETYLLGLFHQYQPKLRQYRDQRARPDLDRKIVTSWNGLAISALALAYGVYGDHRYLEAAEKAATYLWRVHHRDNGGLYRSSYNDTASNEGVLDDYAFFANGLIDLFQVTDNLEYLKRALSLIEYAMTNFAGESGGFYFTAEGSETPIGRRIELFDSVEPSGNAVMLQALLKVSAITGNTRYHDEVKRALDAYSEIIAKSRLEMACWLDTGLKYYGPFYELIIAGGKDSLTHDLTDVFWKAFPCHAVLISIPESGVNKETAAILQSAKDKIAQDGKPTAYVCKFGTCQLPTTNPTQLQEQLMDGWER